MRGKLALALAMRRLGPEVSDFFRRARSRARRDGDRFSLDSAARPAELVALLRLARGCTAVVELGTGTGWSAIALALDDHNRRVISYDPFVRPERERYLDLVDLGVRERVELRALADDSGPGSGDPPVELLFVDSEHVREAVLRAWAAWRGALAPGATVVFHDYGHPHYPGVREAVGELGLEGVQRGGLFVWRAPAGGGEPRGVTGPA